MKYINGILLIYHRPLHCKDALTVWEHINAFQKYSRFKVFTTNTELGFPGALNKFKFSVIVLHYSLFGSQYYKVDDNILEYLDKCLSSYKVVFFQDEYYFCPQRFKFVNHYKVDCVYTLVEAPYFKDTYQKYTSVPKLVYNIPGYVSEELINRAQQMTISDEKCTIDVGYRGRRLLPYMGRAALEKSEIATNFKKHATHLGLKLDIEADECKRIYGKRWYKFLANCRACLGVEAGVSVFDVEGIVYSKYQQLASRYPNVSSKKMIDLLEDTMLRWENRIPYRTISPRHFESAAFRTCQILFEGKYSGVMQPMVHYIPLKKDFSNFDEVIKMFRDRRLRARLTENAYEDLISSGRYSYKKFIEDFDNGLFNRGIRPDSTNIYAYTNYFFIKEVGFLLLVKTIYKTRIFPTFRLLIFLGGRMFLRVPFPGRDFLKSYIKSVLSKYNLKKRNTRRSVQWQLKKRLKKR